MICMGGPKSGYKRLGLGARRSSCPHAGQCADLLSLVLVTWAPRLADTVSVLVCV